MNDQVLAASQIQEMMTHPGWAHVLAMLDEQAQEPKDELYEIMSRKPDTLTGKTAVRLAARCAALRDFKESVNDRLKILAQPRRGG